MGQQHDSQTSFDTTRSSPEPIESVLHRARSEGIVEYKAIPWADGRDEAGQNSDTMTVNLALWWLHLIAIGKRDIGDDYGYLRDALWEEDTKDQEQGLEDQVDGAQHQVPDAIDQVPDIKAISLEQVSIRRLQMAGVFLGVTS